MKLPIYQIDAFTQTLFGGNYAAVVPLEDWLSDTLLQAIATENNVSETAFFIRDAQGRFLIRWFSTSKEIAFCGHATLATAFVIFNRTPEIGEIDFYADAVGDFSVARQADGKIEMNFPAQLASPVADDELPASLYQGLSIRPIQVLRNRQAYIAVFNTEAEVRALVPDQAALMTLAPYDTVITAPGESCDFVSRYFWPSNGSLEDPVTGSIHTALAPYWSTRLQKTELEAIQASPRVGHLSCRIDGDRVYIAGHAVQYMQGFIEVSEA